MTITVIGIGNTLLRDDGIGVRVVEALRDSDLAETAGAAFIDGGTMGFRLAGLIAGQQACILVDAADLGAAPGTVRTLAPQDLDRWFADGGRSSAHEAGLIDLLGMVRLEGALPSRLAIVAIQPADTTWGESLTEAAVGAIPKAMAAVRGVLAQWTAGQQAGPSGRENAPVTGGAGQEMQNG